MTAKAMKDLKDKALPALVEEEAKLRKELFDFQFKHGTRQLADPQSMKRHKRRLARVLTLQNQRKREAAAAASTEKKG